MKIRTEGHCRRVYDSLERKQTIAETKNQQYLRTLFHRQHEPSSNRLRANNAFSSLST